MFEDKNFMFILIGVVVCALVLVIAVDLTSEESMISQATQGRAYTKELQQFRSMVQLGTPVDQVPAMFEQQGFEHLQLMRTDAGGYEIRPPLTYGRNNWILQIGVLSDAVASVRVRSYADNKVRPRRAPEDIAYH